MSREHYAQALPYPLRELAENAETLTAISVLEGDFDACTSDLARHQQRQRAEQGPELNAAERAAVVQLDRHWPNPPARLWRRWQRLLVPLGVVAPSDAPGPVNLPQLVLLAASVSQQTSSAWALTQADSIEDAIALRHALGHLHPALRDRSIAMLSEDQLPWCWRVAVEEDRLAERAGMPVVADWTAAVRGSIVSMIFAEDEIPPALDRWLFEDLPAGTPPRERWRYLRMDQLVVEDEPLLTALLSPTDWMVEPSLIAAAALRTEQQMEWLVELARLPKEGQPPRLYDLLDATESLPPSAMDPVSLRRHFAAAATVWDVLSTVHLLTTTMEACEGSVPWDLLLALSLRFDLEEAIAAALPDLDDYEVDARHWVAAVRWAGRAPSEALRAQAPEAAELPLASLLVSTATPAANPLFEKLRSPLSSYAAGMNRDLASAYGNEPSPIAPSTQPSIIVTSSDES